MGNKKEVKTITLFEMETVTAFYFELSHLNNIVPQIGE